MAQDFLDLLSIKTEEVLKGTYYDRRPVTPMDSGTRFAYDIVDEPRSAYGNLINNLNTTIAYQTIKTNDLCGFKVKGYCVTQEGGLWQIQEVEQHLVAKKNKQALRIIRKTIETVYVLRMIKVDNPWEIR